MATNQHNQESQTKVKPASRKIRLMIGLACRTGETKVIEPKRVEKNPSDKQALFCPIQGVSTRHSIISTRNCKITKIQGISL